MAGNYEKGIYNQLVEVMACLDSVENKRLTNENERLKSIINHDSSNTSTKADIPEKIESGNCIHEIKETGVLSSGNYAAKYVVDLQIDLFVTEIRIFEDERGQNSEEPAIHGQVR